MSLCVRGICVLLVVCSSGCSILPHKQPPPVTYDFGVPSAPSSNALRPTIAFQGVSAPVWLDSNSIEYRLAYDDGFRRQSYRDSRWVAPPAVLIRQRFAERVAQDATAEEADSMPLLRIELDEFIQIFDTPTKSRVKVQLRAIIRSPKTPAYSRDRIFVVEKPASSGDSEGAIRAFAAAVDQIVADTLIWSAQR